MPHVNLNSKTPQLNPIKIPSFSDKHPKITKVLEITGIVLGIFAIISAITLIVGIAFGFPGGLAIGGAVLLGVGISILAGAVVSLVKRELANRKNLHSQRLLKQETQRRKDIQALNPRLNFDVKDSWPLYDQIKHLFANFDFFINSHTKSILKQIRLDDSDLSRNILVPSKPKILEKNTHLEIGSDSEELFETPRSQSSISEVLNRKDVMEEILLDEHTSLYELAEEVISNHKLCVELLESRRQLLSEENLQHKSLNIPGVESRNFHLVDVCSRIIDGLSSAGGVLSVKIPALSKNMQKIYVAVVTILVIGAISTVVLTAAFVSGGIFLLPLLLAVALGGAVVVASSAHVLKLFLSKTNRNKKEQIEELKESLDINKLKVISDLQNQLLVSLQFTLNKEKQNAAKHANINEKYALIRQTLAKNPEKLGSLFSELRRLLQQLRMEDSDIDYTVAELLSGEIVNTDRRIQEILKQYDQISSAIQLAEEEQKYLWSNFEVTQNDMMSLYQDFINLLEQTKEIMDSAQKIQDELIQALERS